MTPEQFAHLHRYQYSQGSSRPDLSKRNKQKNKQTTNNRQLCIGTSTARDPWIQLGVVFIAWFNNQLEENEPMLEILGLIKDRNQTMIKGGLLKNKLEAIETSERMSTK